jgi:aldose 1-epimerase
VISAQGATLLSLTQGELSLIEGPPVASAFAPDGRGQVLAPWPNRLAGGNYTWNGSSYQLPINEIERNCAIHGLVRWSHWQQARTNSSATSISLDHRILPQPGYPFCLDLQVSYALSENGLCVTTKAKVPGEPGGLSQPGTLVPFGLGFHPYLTPGTPGNLNEWLLELPVDSVLTCDERGLPTGIVSLNKAEERLNLRKPSPIGNLVLDHTFQIAWNSPASEGSRASNSFPAPEPNQGEPPAKRAEAILSDPESGVQVVLWCNEGFKWLQCFTGDTLPAERKRRAVAIEPMTCPPNAFATGWDVIALAEGNEWVGQWGLELKKGIRRNTRATKGG